MRCCCAFRTGRAARYRALQPCPQHCALVRVVVRLPRTAPRCTNLCATAAPTAQHLVTSLHSRVSQHYAAAHHVAGPVETSPCYRAVQCSAKHDDRVAAACQAMQKPQPPLHATAVQSVHRHVCTAGPKPLPLPGHFQLQTTHHCSVSKHEGVQKHRGLGQRRRCQSCIHAVWCQVLAIAVPSHGQLLQECGISSQASGRCYLLFAASTVCSNSSMRSATVQYVCVWPCHNKWKLVFIEFVNNAPFVNNNPVFAYHCAESKSCGQRLVTGPRLLLSC